MNKVFIPNLVSVIIPCYNHQEFLAIAIKSILSQSYRHFEIIVVDDGSTDNSKEVACAFKDVNYVFQKNSGLSSARNTGINQSQGEFLVFLDADDWLLSYALETNIRYLLREKEAKFVSGAYRHFYQRCNSYEDKVKYINGSPYLKLLEENYISMIAAVMFRRCVFETFSFDVSLATCEDYDLYLRVARKEKVLHHHNVIAIYRFHGSNISYGSSKMLTGSLQVLKNQQAFLTRKEEKVAWNNGVNFCKKFYSKEAYKFLLATVGLPLKEKNDIGLLYKYNKVLFIKYWKARVSFYIKSLIKQSVFK